METQISEAASSLYNKGIESSPQLSNSFQYPRNDVHISRLRTSQLTPMPTFSELQEVVYPLCSKVEFNISHRNAIDSRLFIN